MTVQDMDMVGAVRTVEATGATGAGFSCPVPVLVDLLTGALVAVSKDDTLPTIAAVQVRWSTGGDAGAFVEATATDRYRLVTGRTRGMVAARGEGSALLVGDDAVRVLKALKVVKVPRNAAPQDVPWAHLDVAADGLSVTVATGDGVTRAALVDGAFPKWESLLPSDDVLTGDGIGAEGARFNLGYLASFDKVPHERNAPVRVRFHAQPLRPALMDFPTDRGPVAWRCLLMPVRVL